MKKAIKLLLALSLMIPTVAYTIDRETVVVQAKISGDYTYELINDTKVEITNYNGSEKNVTIPAQIDGKDVTKIGYGAFAESKSIETLVIPDTVTIIDSYAFSQCGQINSIELPNSVVSMGRYAFAGNHSLENIKIPNKIRSIGYGVFFDCISLTDIDLPEGLQNIGATAFGNCRSLKSLKLPSSMISLESNAFSDCIALESVVIPDGVTTLGSSVFSGCLSLNNIELPETLTSIGQSTFKDCIALESIYLPQHVTTLGYALFSGCTSLKDVNIPKSVSSIGNATFSGCSSLTTLDIPNTVEELGENIFSGCTGLEEIYLPDSVKKIGASAFAYCSNLKKVRLPKNLKKLESSTFRYCDSLESVVIPSGVTELKETVFADCPELKSVSFPSTVSTIGSRILSGSPQAVMLVPKNSKPYSYAVNNSYNWRYIESGINLDKATLNMTVGDINYFSVIIAPYTVIDNKQLKWVSSNPTVVEVDADGNVTALSAGSAVITASNANGQSASAEVTVDDTIVPIETITLNNETLTMKKDTSVGLRASVSPNNTTMSKLIKWESDNTEIVTVGSTGSLLARHPGTTTVRAISSNGLVAECEVTVISEIKSVSLNQTAMTLDLNVKQQLRATINPSDTTQSKEVTWVSSNTKVATVDQNGEVTTVSPGTATITVTTVNGKKAECKITVVKPQVPTPIESVSLNKKDLDLIEGTSGRLTATINPSDTTDDKTLIWTTSDPSVATVSNGTVTAIKEGTAIITVTTSNGKTASCTVTVTKKVIEITGVTLNETTLALDEGQIKTLSASIQPANTTEDQTLSWTSSDESVATVTDGKVTAVKEGTAIITVTTSNGKTASCTVTVSKKQIAIERVTLSMHQVTLKAGMQQQLSATIAPADTTDDKTLNWSSNNETVAKVDENGMITAVAEGTAVIRVTTSNGLTDECVVTVYEIKKQALKDAIQSAALLKEELYTVTTYQNLASILAEARIVYDNSDATQADVDEMVSAIENAVNLLIERATDAQIQQFTDLLNECKKLQDSVNESDFVRMLALIQEGEALLAQEHGEIAKLRLVDLQEKLMQEKDHLDIVGIRMKLKQIVELANTILEGDLSGIDGEAIKALRAAVSDAQYLLDTQSTDRESLNTAIKQVETAIEKCEAKAETIHLRNLLEVCANYKQNQYTENSWNDYAKALKHAETVLNDPAASQAQVDDAYQQLTEKMVALKVKVNTAMLEYHLQSVNDILAHSNDYVAYTIKGLEDIAAQADALLAKKDITSEEVNEMNLTLIKAIMKARLKGN